jgi:molecular chaperone HtpG
MSIYREYVQNSADAIDDAREAGILASQVKGRVEFGIDPDSRTVRIRDNGTGIPAAGFVERMTAFGASRKRGRNSRGFRGVGRLAGIGYCQELIFRSRVAGEKSVSELRWDCRKLKALLRSEDQNQHLRDTVLEAVTVRKRPSTGFPERFFEVELRGIIRHKNDQLLEASSIYDFLAQVAPVPFAPDFKYSSSIQRALSSVKLGDIEIALPGIDHPVYRPHRDRIELGGGKADFFTELEIIDIPGMDSDTAAAGWILHHGYSGALPSQSLQKGLRLRVGNIQIGDDRILEALFAEPRFNSWSVGEIHILDARVIPNGRRDNFEQNAHYLNILNHLTPVARDLSKRCRDSSIRRNRQRDFCRSVEVARESLSIIKQGSLSRTEQARLLREAQAAIARAERLKTDELFGPEEVRADLEELKQEVATILGAAEATSPLDRLPRTHRQAYQKVFSLIYECAPNRTVAKAIVDRIMTRL